MTLASFPCLKDVYNDIKTVIAFNEVPSFKDERQNDYFNCISNAMEKARKPNKLENQKGVFLLLLLGTKFVFMILKQVFIMVVSKQSWKSVASQALFHSQRLLS